MSHPRTLAREKSLLVVVDVQEAYDGLTVEHRRMERGVRTLLQAARLLDVPVVATEQYPKGLGRLVPAVRDLLPDDAPVIEKLSMSCCGAPEFRAALDARGRSQVVVCGIEAHACVNQTVHDLLDEGLAVHLPYDAISARFEHDYRTGWDKMIGSGAVPATVEMICLEWVRTAAAPQFKALHQLIK